LLWQPLLCNALRAPDVFLQRGRLAVRAEAMVCAGLARTRRRVVEGRVAGMGKRWQEVGGRILGTENSCQTDAGYPGRWRCHRDHRTPAVPSSGTTFRFSPTIVVDRIVVVASPTCLFRPRHAHPGRARAKTHRGCCYRGKPPRRTRRRRRRRVAAPKDIRVAVRELSGCSMFSTRRRRGLVGRKSTDDMSRTRAGYRTTEWKCVMFAWRARLVGLQGTDPLGEAGDGA
jgi:hypothetical protein